MDGTRTSSTERVLPWLLRSLPFLGVITRTEYQACHRNPTCHFQSSSAGCGSESVNHSSDDDNDHMLVSDLWKKAKLNQESSVEDGEPSHILIKDLRARRVYSPQSVGETFSYSSPNVDTVESKVESSCRDLEMVSSGSGSASGAENNDRAEEVSKRDGDIYSFGERLPSESRSKDEINSILSSIAKEYRSEIDDDPYSDGALKTMNEETKSPVVGFPFKAQGMDHAIQESVCKGKQLNCQDGTDALERLDNVYGLPKLTTPLDDVETYGKVKVAEDGGKQAGAIHIKDTQLIGKAEESNPGDRNDYLKSKLVLRPRLRRKLFKSPGSVSYRRLLPFIMDMIKDDSGTSILGHGQNDKKDNDAKQVPFPLSSLCQETSKDQLSTDSRPRNDNDEFRVLVDNSDLFGANESKLTSYRDFPESPKQLSTKEAVHVENVEFSVERLSNTGAEEVVDVHYDKDDANAVFSNVHGCKAEAVGGIDTSEKLCVVNQQCSCLPDDADLCVENKNAPGSTYVNTLDLTPNNQANAGEEFFSNATKRKYNVLRSKSVLKPCLQRKLFKTPGSVSYKRLLPFLKDIAKDDCGAPKLGQDQKDERVMGSQPPFLFQSRESPMEELETDSCPMRNTVDEANAIQDATTIDAPFHGDCNTECSLNLPNPVAKIDSRLTLSSPVMNETTPREHSTSVSHQLSDYTEAKRDSSSNGEMHINISPCCQKSQTKDLEKRRTPTVGLKKGILKRNPRGCRGLCTCLNCASFRLHAERAFEFSRNLFLDAEEVALDLTKELSHLRSLLERRTDGANNHHVDENQVKEACRKAFAAEQLAKGRLSEMEDDLNIHCRITSFQQPRVKFANYIEEKVISPGRLSGQ